MLNSPYKFTRAGRQFVACFEPDDGMGMPWQERDMHGPVRKVNTRRGYKYQNLKRPGEVLIDNGQRNYWAYDVQAAVKMARKDWGFANGKDAADAVARDVKYCQAWLRGDRWYSQLSVQELDAEGELIGEPAYLGGFDSGYDAETVDYAKEYAHELADELLYPRKQAWRAALKNARFEHAIARQGCGILA